ncbi:hypothetical protein DV737_g3475, partial [Chaetothyriales sp. CBS 132003]
MTADHSLESPTSPTLAAASAHSLDTAIAAETKRQQPNPTSIGNHSPLPRSPAVVPPSCTDYRTAIARISTPLVPLISVTTGLAHPHFPRSLLQFYLLTHDQLDSLARWYHQVDPAVEETWIDIGIETVYNRNTPTIGMSDPKNYTVGWICAITTEYVAARAFLDQVHDDLGNESGHDNNAYTLGRIGKHNVVIAVLPEGEYESALWSASAAVRQVNLTISD